jgi:hypothetical protein
VVVTTLPIPAPLVVLDAECLLKPELILNVTLQDSVWTLQSRRPQPSVYVRSFLQSLIFFDMKALRAMSLKQLLYDDLAEVTLPASPLLDRAYEEVELPSDPRFQIAKSMDEFVQRMGSVSTHFWF